MQCEIKVETGDITEQEVDAIVNTAHQDLLGGGGVDGAIHSAAGPELREACRRIGGCPPGEARITQAYGLPCRYVLHTVCPTYSGAGAADLTLLKRCYVNTLRLAREHDCKSIAFPAIGCGHCHFPPDIAARIAMRSIALFLEDDKTMESIVLVCSPAEFLDDTFEASRQSIFGEEQEILTD